MDKSHLNDLRAVLDYAQPDEEHDWNLNPEDDHIVYPMRRLRAALEGGTLASSTTDTLREAIERIQGERTPDRYDRMNAYEVRVRAEALIGADYVPVDELKDLLRRFDGDES